jgi:haloacid dehalogenase superfamily, subfamily IA, variant 3 with third motif having DD or ED
MPAKPQLVLDVGGVLLANLDPFWRTLAELAGAPYDELRARYRREMRGPLWSGGISEPDFWSWLAAAWPGLDAAAARQALLHSMRPLPALNLLPAWSGLADLHILSNHRAEWVRPALRDVLPRFAGVTISSEAGSFKPNPEIYAAAAAKMPPGAPVLFVDDHPGNLRAAEAFGWRTLLADEADSRWTEAVEPLLRTLG